MSRTRRLIDVETHVSVFTWVLERLADAGLVRGTTVGIDATTAAMRSVRRLAEASGVEIPTPADLARFDRSPRENKKTSNKEWQSPQIATRKDGRTHLAHKAERGVDMDTGAIVSVTVQDRKSVLIQAAAYNIGLLLRCQTGIGTPRIALAYHRTQARVLRPVLSAGAPPENLTQL